MYLTRTPKFIRKSFPGFVWNMASDKKEIYLTFDDGPVPTVTPFVLKSLQKYKAKATFFCVGENIENNPTLFQQIKAEGHSVGSHSYNHLSGWTTDNQHYLNNVNKAAKLSRSNLFRPPYGRIKPSQAKDLLEELKIVMWDVLSGDFDPEITKDECYNNVVSNAQEGSIVVFHDSLKSYKILQQVLPEVLAYYDKLGYVFKAITEEALLAQSN